jgi:multidrug transporter EmrE-like cation transporter
LRQVTVALMLTIAISLGVVGQIALKYGMRQHGAGLSTATGVGIVANLLHAIFTPYVLLGLGCYVVSTGFWLLVISRWNLSYAYPMIAVGYIGVVFLSRLIFKEQVTPPQWVGIVLMIGGLVLVASFGSASGQRGSAGGAAEGIRQVVPAGPHAPHD